MRLLSLLLSLLAPAAAADKMIAANFAADLKGDPDTRPGTWGRAAAHVWRLEFRNVPAGKRVRIKRVYGDFVAWARGSPPPDKHAGVLLGLQRTDVGASPDAWPAAEGCVLYLQHAVVGSQVARLDYDYRDLSFVLADDHVLEVKVAVWLNDLEEEVHMEPTFVLYYDYVDSEGR